MQLEERQKDRMKQMGGNKVGILRFGERVYGAGGTLVENKGAGLPLMCVRERQISIGVMLAQTLRLRSRWYGNLPLKGCTLAGA